MRGHVAQAAAKISSGIGGLFPPLSCRTFWSTHSPYGSGLSIGSSSYGPTKGVEYRACHSGVLGVNGTAEATHSGQKIFSYFFLFQSLFISEGILAYFPLSSLVDPNHLGEPPGVADGRGMTRRTRR